MEEDHDLAKLLAQEGIVDKNVLRVIGEVTRAEFVNQEMLESAYLDQALPIDCGQTISQPYIVARMTELLLNGRDYLDKVLEIGTGSGYQSAILAKLADHVYTIERIEVLHEQATQRFAKLEIKNVQTFFADGAFGLEKHAPFDGIIVTAAAPDIPGPLFDQLDSKGGVLVIPVDIAEGMQELRRVTRNGDEFEIEIFDLVSFVPLKKNLE